MASRVLRGMSKRLRRRVKSTSRPLRMTCSDLGAPSQGEPSRKRRVACSLPPSRSTYQRATMPPLLWPINQTSAPGFWARQPIDGFAELAGGEAVILAPVVGEGVERRALRIGRGGVEVVAEAGEVLQQAAVMLLLEERRREDNSRRRCPPARDRRWDSASRQQLVERPAGGRARRRAPESRSRQARPVLRLRRRLPM
jgi:hypothetical protein